MRKATILASFLSLLATACSMLQTVSPAGMKAYELSLATAGDRAAIVWHGTTRDAQPDAIFLQPLDGRGQPAGAPHRITDGTRYAYEPDLQLLDDDALIAWYEKDTSSGKLTAWLARTDMGGRIIWQRQLDAGVGNARNPVVRVANGVVSTAWIEGTPSTEPAVWTTSFSPDGFVKAQPRRAGKASHDTWNLNAAVDQAGTFYVTYDAQLGTKANELRLLAIGTNAIHDLAISDDDGFASVYPDLGISADGQAALTWFDERDGNEEIYLSVQPLFDLIAGKRSPDQRLTRTAASSIGAYLSWNDNTLAVAWCDAQPGQQELYAQKFDLAGMAMTPVRRLTETPTQSSIPSIRPWKAGFLIAWNEYLSVEGEGIHRPIRSSTAMVTTFVN